MSQLDALSPRRLLDRTLVRIGGFALFCALPGLAHARTVELTVVNQLGNSIETHRWARALEQAGFDRVRIGGSGMARDTQPAVQRTGEVVLVTGVLDASQRLRLPGNTFTRGDREGLAAWVEQIRAGGEDDSGLAFGLTPSQLVQLNQRFASVRVNDTAGRDTRETLRRIANRLDMQLVLSPEARSELSAAGPVLDELSGLSAGTSLAALLRPWGLALVPHQRPDGVVLNVKPFQASQEFWPIGWPPREPTNQVGAKLFEREQVEIRDVTLQEALAALQPAIEMPFLLDHNAMARQRIDPQTVRVSFPSARTIFKRVVSRVLTQAKLKSELRVDEAGQPFLWLSPIRDTP